MAGNISTPTEDSDSLPPLVAINVTPFVDVVLVLLVIFMVTAPMLSKDLIGIRLPKAKTSDGKKMETLSFAVTKQGNILFNGELASEETIRSEVRKALKSNPETQAILSADREAIHGDLVKVIDWIKSEGLSRFAIQIEKQK